MRKSSEKASVDEAQPRTPQRQRGRDRVAALLASAADVFAEKGFDAATMTEIAARAEASIGTLYLFFPTKEALAQALLEDLADRLSVRLDALQARLSGLHAADIADALFAELGAFLEVHPVYGMLLDHPGDDEWRRSVRMRRRCQIASLFAHARPALTIEKAERLALIVPQLMRMTLVVSDEKHVRDGVIAELRLMLKRHLNALDT